MKYTEIELPYGDSFLKARIPTQNLAFVLNTKFIEGLKNEREAIIESLRSPIGCPPLLDLISKDDKVVILATDNTRPCPDDRILPPILAELEEKIPRENITIIVAVGLHPPLNEQELTKKLGEDIVENYNVMNHELVKPFPYLLEAGETAGRMVGVKVVDASDIIKTLNGFSVIGWSEVKVQRRIFSFLRRRTSIDQLNPATMCQMSLVDASIRLTAECDIKSVKRALFLIAGPPSELSREGVERARSWLQQVVGDAEVRGGDFPIPGEKKITGILVLSGIDLDNLPRLKKIMSKISLR